MVELIRRLFVHRCHVHDRLESFSCHFGSMLPLLLHCTLPETWFDDILT